MVEHLQAIRLVARMTTFLLWAALSLISVLALEYFDKLSWRSVACYLTGLAVGVVWTLYAFIVNLS